MEGAGCGGDRRRMQQQQVITDDRHRKKLKHMEICEEFGIGASSIHMDMHAAAVSLYQGGRQPCDRSIFLPNHSKPLHEGDPSSTTVALDNPKVLPNVDADRDTNNLEVQTQVPAQTRQQPTFMQLLCGEEDFDLPPYVPDEVEDNNHNYAESTSQLGNSAYDIWTGAAQLEPQEHMPIFGSISGIGSQLPGCQIIEIVDDNIGSGLASPRDNQLQGGHLALLMSYIRAYAAPDQQIPTSLVISQPIEQPVTSHFTVQKPDTVNSTSGIGHSDYTFQTVAEEMFGGVVNFSPPNGDLGPF